MIVVNGEQPGFTFADVVTETADDLTTVAVAVLEHPFEVPVTV
jgi:hypothetical protein